MAERKRFEEYTEEELQVKRQSVHNEPVSSLSSTGEQK